MLGHLCKSSGIDFTSKEITHLVELIVANPDPNARAGCAMALGYIHSELGGMAASFHLQTTLGILSQLAADAHPVVHFWALDALSRIADAAGIAFAGHVISTLGLLAQLYALESHGMESASLPLSNLEDDLPTPVAITRCVNSLVNVLGPDVQDISKARHLIFTMTDQFSQESSTLLVVENLRCMESLSLFAPGHVPFEPYVRELKGRLGADDSDVRDRATNGLYNLMRKGAEEVIQVGETGLEDQLWLSLNDAYGNGLVRTLIEDWIHQSGISKITVWIRRLQAVLTKQTSSAQTATAIQPAGGINEQDVQDDEVAGFAVSASQSAKGDNSNSLGNAQGLLRWQVHAAAIHGLRDILRALSRDRTKYSATIIKTLQPKIGDVVRIAFSASTSAVNELRVLGIGIIGLVLEVCLQICFLFSPKLMASRSLDGHQILIFPRQLFLNSTKRRSAQLSRQPSRLTPRLSWQQKPSLCAGHSYQRAS